MQKQTSRLYVLLEAVLLNYIAQIPYYLHQYYFPRHLMPAWQGTIVLGLTLIWFLVGHFGYLKNKKYGLPVLLSFLAAQVLFYGHAIVLGLITGAGAAAQLRTHDPFLFVIFSIGYVNFGVAAYYLYSLLTHRAMQLANNH